MRDLLERGSCLDDLRGGGPAGAGGSTEDESGAGFGGAHDLARLARTIEGEVIPRLMLAHAAVARGSGRTDAPGPMPSDVDALARIVVQDDVAVASAMVETFRMRGTPLDSIFLDLLAPTARRLGALWEADEAQFMDVTVGLFRLQQVLRELAPAFEQEAEICALPPRILLAPIPGEQHLFGVMIVEELCRRAGWEVWPCMTGAATDVRALVQREWFDAVGFSMAQETSEPQLADLIRLIRRASVNRSVIVMVGGRAFAENATIGDRVGADLTAVDGRDAIRKLQTLIPLRATGGRGMDEVGGAFGSGGERGFR